MRKKCNAVNRIDFSDRWIKRMMVRLIVRGPDECWEWNGSKLPTGYTKAHCGARDVYVHRIMYCLCVADIPAGLVIDHLCDNPSCVNPKHLRLTTDRENLLRSTKTIAGINARKRACPQCGGPYKPRKWRHYNMRHCYDCWLLSVKERAKSTKAA